MHAAIRHYKLNPDSSAEFNRKVKEGFVPIVSAVRGFVSYRAIEADNGSWTSISVFETRESADESVRLAADFVRQHLRPLIASGPDIIEGPVVIHEP